jgi:glycosyltransferase involved in cell wall biosynthesis
MVMRVGLEREITSAYIAAFRRHNAKAVLAEYGTTGVLTVEACRRLGIPLVVHFHGFDASVRSVLEEYAARYVTMFRDAASIVAVSQDMRRRLISLGAPPEKVQYVPCGVDCRMFDGADPEAAPPVFVAVGRFVEKKGPQLTIRAFAQVYRAHPEARLRMVGEGPLMEECRDLVTNLGINGVVTLLGSQPHDMIREEMCRARCFVQHSVQAVSGDCEGTPVGILEAGASGLPVVSTRHAGIPEVVVEEETGLLVDEGDVDGMAEHMTRMIREPHVAGRLGRAGRERVSAHFSMERSLSQLWDAISNCISRP